MTFHAGDLTLDLVNTVAWRLDPTRRDDRLPTGEALARWAAPLTGPHPADWWSAALAPVTRLREQLTEALTTDTSDGLRLTLAAAIRRAELTDVFPPQWTVTIERPRDLADLIAVHALRFLQAVDPTRIRQCADDACGWLFLDRSRNNTRRWCDSTDCGNRNRVRQHYHRAKAPR